jgi:hypothetical protein
MIYAGTSVAGPIFLKSTVLWQMIGLSLKTHERPRDCWNVPYGSPARQVRRC